MPYRILQFESTPNPNATKVLVEPSPATTPRSYRQPDAPADDPLARALFNIPGVTNLLIHDGWISVGKAPDADWKTLKAAIRQTLSNTPHTDHPDAPRPR
ncbi:MAG: NifU N-terminal domain-containing protein [Phycisphaerales bacterium JB040]